MERIFPLLLFFADDMPRGGAEQMALDEVLFESAGQPVLRHYRWAGEVVTFGRAQSLAEAVRAQPGLPAVRRWTGGGIVRHGRDWTFSLVVPHGEPFAALPPSETYRLLHAAAAEALQSCGVAARLARAEEALAGPACFESPSPFDILGVGGKLCGGAQRRTRRGFLHQGSIQCAGLPTAFGGILAGFLAAEVRPFRLSAATEAGAAVLARDKYGSALWTERIP